MWCLKGKEGSVVLAHLHLPSPSLPTYLPAEYSSIDARRLILLLLFTSFCRICGSLHDELGEQGMIQEAPATQTSHQPYIIELYDHQQYDQQQLQEFHGQVPMFSMTRK